MKVLSLFDGISGAMQALKIIGIVPKVYYASEIDKYAIKISEKNHPEIMRIGDVNNVVDSNYKNFDLMIWGSPCQDLSIAKKDRKGLDGERSGLFWKALEIWKAVQPKYWLMENVASMPKEAKETISRELGVEPVMINSAFLTAQNRKRLYWTNIPGVTQPEDKGILLKDIIENGEVDRSKSYCIDANYYKGICQDEEKRKKHAKRTFVKLGNIGKGGQGDRIYSTDGKSVCLSANGGGRGTKTGLYLITGAAARTRPNEKVEGVERKKEIEVRQDEKSNCLTGVQTDSLVSNPPVIRKLTPIECERLQGYPDNYTEGISNTQRYKCLGNSFTVPVIAHILKGVKREM